MKLRLFPILAGCVFVAIVSIPAQDSPSAAPAPAASPAEDLSQYKSPDALWDYIEKLKDSGSAISDAEGAQKLFNQIIGATRVFRLRYDKDPRRWDAALINASAQAGMASVTGTAPDESLLEKTYKEVAAAPDATKSARMEARLNLIGSEMQKAAAKNNGGDNETLSPELDRMMASFIHDFPDSPDDADLQGARLKSLQKTAPAKADKLLAALLKDQNPAVEKMAESAVRSRDLLKKPLELKFTAVDGSPVDVTKLRGKVVLIDYWATWCGPCMEKVPEIVAAYKEYHDKGLEIVGISLDQDQDRMQSVTKEQGMTWPQYFDGKGWDNNISASYGIDSIPRMWLVDRKGMVVDTDAEEGVTGKIGKLIAE